MYMKAGSELATAFYIGARHGRIVQSPQETGRL